MPDETPVTDAPAEVAPPVEAPAPVDPAPPAVEAVAPAAPDPAPAPVTPPRRRIVPPPPPAEEPPVDPAAEHRAAGEAFLAVGATAREAADRRAATALLDALDAGVAAAAAATPGAHHRAAVASLDAAMGRAAAALGIESAPEVLPPYVVVDGKRCPIVVDPRGPGCVQVTINLSGDALNGGVTRSAESLRVALAMLGREFGEVVT